MSPAAALAPASPAATYRVVQPGPPDQLWMDQLAASEVEHYVALTACNVASERYGYEICDADTRVTRPESGLVGEWSVRVIQGVVDERVAIRVELDSSPGDKHAADLLALAPRCTDEQLGRVLRASLSTPYAPAGCYAAYLAGGLETLSALGPTGPASPTEPEPRLTGGSS